MPPELAPDLPSKSWSFYLQVVDVHFRSPIFDLMDPKWLQWARKIQAIAQTGLHFTSSEYDRERYQQLQTIAIEIFGECSDTEVSTIRAIFDRERGYATPKVDVRGVVFAEQKILLVQERSDGLWTLPGGWADVNDSPSEAAEREIREESGYIAKADRLLALFDRTKHPHLPAFPFHVYKLFILCRLTGGGAKRVTKPVTLGFSRKTRSRRSRSAASRRNRFSFALISSKIRTARLRSTNGGSNSN